MLAPLLPRAQDGRHAMFGKQWKNVIDTSRRLMLDHDPSCRAVYHLPSQPARTFWHSEPLSPCPPRHQSKTKKTLCATSTQDTGPRLRCKTPSFGTIPLRPSAFRLPPLFILMTRACYWPKSPPPLQRPESRALASLRVWHRTSDLLCNESPLCS